MKATELFKGILDIAAVQLKQQGFAKKGLAFSVHEGENWGVVEFQKSRSSTPNSLKFTINAATFSAAVARVVSGRVPDAMPSTSECHFVERVAAVVKNRDDFWWVLTDGSPLSGVESDVREVLTVAAHDVKTYIRDEELRSLWLSGRSPGATHFQRLRYLTTLLKSIGPEELFESAKQELVEISRNRPTEATATAHLRRLGIAM